MKLNRLVEIIIILMNKQTITAGELAERFDVSIRTIYRDIDVLSSSGVPIYTTQGIGGGISIMEGYSLNRTILSDNDKESILIALKTLQSTKYPDAEAVCDKLGSIFNSNLNNNVKDWIKIDFSPWGGNPNSYNKFLDIKASIFQSRIIKIDYINAQNEKSTRHVEPLQLEFKYQAWYLYGYCLLKKDYRTFRISRIKSVVMTEKTFDRNQIHLSESDTSEDRIEEKKFIHCKLIFTKDALHRLYDDYDVDEIHDNGDDTYTLETDYPDDDWVYGYILSFGTHAKVVSPENVKNTIKDMVTEMRSYYEC